MLISRKRFFTRLRWIAFNRGRADRRSRPHGAAFYGESSEGKSSASENSATEFSENRGCNSGVGNLSVDGGLRRNQKGIPFHGRSQRQYFRGYAVRGDFGKAWEYHPGRGDGHAQVWQCGSRQAAKWQPD